MSICECTDILLLTECVCQKHTFSVHTPQDAIHLPELIMNITNQYSYLTVIVQINTH